MQREDSESWAACGKGLRKSKRRPRAPHPSTRARSLDKHNSLQIFAWDHDTIAGPPNLCPPVPINTYTYFREFHVTLTICSLYRTSDCSGIHDTFHESIGRSGEHSVDEKPSGWSYGVRLGALAFGRGCVVRRISFWFLPIATTFSSSSEQLVAHSGQSTSKAFLLQVACILIIATKPSG